MTISEHFSAYEVTFSETASRKGIDNTVPIALMPAIINTAQNMEKVRSLLGAPIKVNSWYRCLELNNAIGSKSTSQHVKGEAVDFVCTAFGDPLAICKKIIASKLAFDQLILEHTWVHISWNSDPNIKQRNQVLSLLANKSYASGLTNINGEKL